MIDLCNDSIPSGALRVLRYHPYVIGPYSEYTHRPRSAYLFADYVSVQYWCGQSIRVPAGAGVAEPPYPVCGTCEGRYLGWRADSNLVFSPRDVFSFAGRVWCPGRQLHLFTSPVGNCRAGTCLVCGWQGSIGHCGGWRDPHMMLTAHKPITASSLIACPYHGWRQLSGYLGGSVRCTSHRCEFVWYPEPGVNLG